MKRSRYAALGWIGAGLAMLGSSGVRAHHEVGVYDREHPITVTGVVTSFLWANPHAWLYLRANDPNHRDWALEGASVATLRHRGWSKHSLSSGDAITVVVAPRRDGKGGGQILQVTLADSGEVLR